MSFWLQRSISFRLLRDTGTGSDILKGSAKRGAAAGGEH